jgi:hypothetical protein
MKKSSLRKELEQKLAKPAKKKCCGICMRRVLRIQIPQRVLKESQKAFPAKVSQSCFVLQFKKNRFAIFAGWRNRQTQKSQNIYFFFAIFASFCSKFFSGFLHFLISGELFFWMVFLCYRKQL